MKKIYSSFIVFVFILILGLSAHYYTFPDIRVSNTETVVIPGVEREYKFLFLTDMHMAIKSEQNLGEQLGDADNRMAAFVNAKGTYSSIQFAQWMKFANRSRLDGLLMGGDMIDYYSDKNVDYLYNNLKTLKIPYLYVLGNHDLYSPWNEKISRSARIYRMFKKGNPSFQSVEFPKFMICAVDNQSYQVTEEALKGMKQAVKKAIEKKKAIILLAHVPFYTENIKSLKDASINTWGKPLIIGEGARDTTEVTREFMKLAFAKNSPVTAVFTGDNHFYCKGNLTDHISECVIDPSFAGNGTIIKIKAKE